MEKTCTKCKQTKSIDEFYKQKNGKYGVTGKCAVCLNEYFKDRYKNHPEKVKENSNRYYAKFPNAKRDALIKNKYKITSQQYEEKLQQQNHSCAICKKPQIELNKKLAIDHCHDSNIIRGLLCTKCNLALGYFNDNILFLENAINYLKDVYIKSI